MLLSEQTVKNLNLFEYLVYQHAIIVSNSNQQHASAVLKHIFNIHWPTNKNLIWQSATGVKEKEVIVHSFRIIFACL